MSTADSTSTTCPVLKGPENYQIWKLRIMGKLREEKVYGVVTGEETSSLSTMSPLVYPDPGNRYADSWGMRDGRAHGIIVRHIDDRIVLQTAHHTTSKALWDAIVELHENVNTGIATFYTFVDMMDLRWDGTSAIDQHIAKLRSGSQKLTQMK
ncbi:hypothetical protein PLICRDRAFT_83650, partial [Plicaturopsis crispa FD-325 SS-3]